MPIIQTVPVNLFLHLAYTANLCFTGVKRPRSDPANLPRTYGGKDVEVHESSRPYIYEKHEAAPDLPIFRGSLHDIDVAIELATLLPWNIVVRREKQDSDDQLDCLAEQLKDLTKIDYGPKLLLALEGDTSTGKSLLLSNLLGKRNLAKSGDFGKSCTQVITEYANREPNQEQYEAHVHWHSMDNIEEIIRRHLENFLEYHRLRKQAATQNDVNNSDSLSSDEMFTYKHTAVELFQTLFCDQKAFATEEALDSELLVAAEGDIEHTIQMLLKNVENVRRTHKAVGKGVTILKTKNLRELHHATKLFSERKNNSVQEPRYWPLVQKIRIYLESPFLGQEIEIADYPGGTDTNTMRKDTSLLYLTQECSAVLITSRIDRASSSSSILKSLTRAIASKGAENIILALTHADICKSDLNDLDELEQKYFASLNDDVEKARDAISEAQDLDDPAAEQEAHVKLAHLESTQTRHRALFRNDKLVPEVQAKYKSLTDPSTLQVVPVANQDYENHMSVHNQLKKPVLDPRETGIPELRQAIYKLVSERKMACVISHQERVRLVSNRLMLWTTRSRLDRKSDVQQIVRWQLETCETLLDDLEDEILPLYQDIFVEGFMSNLKRLWGARIIGQIAVWGSLFPPTSFKAFLARGGTHQPRNGDLLSMTAEIIKLMDEDVWALHHAFLKEMKQKSAWVKSKSDGIFSLVRDGLDKSEHLAGVDMKIFMRVFGQQKARVADQIETETVQLTTDLRYVVKLTATRVLILTVLAMLFSMH